MHKSLYSRCNKCRSSSRDRAIHVIQGTRGQGCNITILGISFDTSLLMHDAARNLTVDSGWRLKTLLMTRRFHNTAEFVRLYKSQILSVIERRTAGLHHAAPSVLASVDRIQCRFPSEIGMSNLEALENWQLAPLACRRSIAMLGLVYRIAHQLAPDCLCRLFEREHRLRDGLLTSSRVPPQLALQRIHLDPFDWSTHRNNSEIVCWFGDSVEFASDPTVSTLFPVLSFCISVR